ncbi:MAG: InlB B-repeat-containing protein [Methanimicrococcus sp.]|nr:InlB B-repeat-containing protein [Methanimicrococcus sp.]
MNKNRTYRKTILFVIAMAIALTLLSGFAMTAYAAAPDITVSNEAELIGAVNTAPAGPISYTIALKNDIELTGTLTIPDGKNIILISEKGGPFTLIGAEYYDTITVFGKLTLGTTDLDGIIVTHIVTQNDGNGGSGVMVESYGLLIMNSGEISGSTGSCHYYGYPAGGGVFVAYAGSFEMYGGTIENNQAKAGGGVFVAETGSFEMYGGKISDNTVFFEGGGGVYVYYAGSFEMYGGKISDNTVFFEGGGGGVVSGGSFEMYGGTIENNSAQENGGGVVVSSGSFEMSGGTIENNSAQENGGGVYVFYGSFEMSGGTIENNSAQENGGGVYVDYFGSFEMYGGTIENNSAQENGGGVYVYYTGSFEIYGGTIANNIAQRAGGGVSLYTLNQFKIPADAVGVVFSNNSAAGAYDRDPKDDGTYATCIVGDVTWSDPFTQGYNNYDIGYKVGTPLVFYTLSFDANADDDDVKGLMSADKPILFNKPHGILPELSRDGYVFAGWFTEAEGGEKVNPSTIVTMADDFVLYAQWTMYVDTGGDRGKDSGSGFGQAVITENNITEQNNSGSDKTPAPPAPSSKETSGGDSEDTPNTSTNGMRGGLFGTAMSLTAPAVHFVLKTAAYLLDLIF